MLSFTVPSKYSNKFNVKKKSLLTTLTKCFAQLCFSDLSQSEKHLDRVTGQVEYIVGVC